MKALQALASSVIKQPAIGQHPVHIGNHQANISQRRPRLRLTPFQQRAHALQALGRIDARPRRLHGIGANLQTGSHEAQLFELFSFLGHGLGQIGIALQHLTTIGIDAHMLEIGGFLRITRIRNR
ncbi:hypothetical protein SDC9_127743 [bioreactor metagenome]|uniref:Uncharacterized protein n=1 Tax=bioreactor metagenome TaxID=1076179 RepID=A0A645CUX5_9ZZZZ